MLPWTKSLFPNKNLEILIVLKTLIQAYDGDRLLQGLLSIDKLSGDVGKPTQLISDLGVCPSPPQSLQSEEMTLVCAHKG